MRQRSISRVIGGVVVYSLLSHLVTLPLCHSLAEAQSTNGTITLVQDTLSTSGGLIGGDNSVTTVTLMAHPAGGIVSNAAFTIVGAYPDVNFGLSGASVLVNVTGTVDDPTATVSVSASGGVSIPATINGSQFIATNVRLFVGANTVTATATDPAGNTTRFSIIVYVDLPAEHKTPSVTMDILGTIDEPTASVTVNGITATIASGLFSAQSVPLVNGLNILTATATDIGGNTATHAIHVFVYTSPPPRPTVGTLGSPIPEVTTASTLTLSGTKTRGSSIWINGTQVVPINDETIWLVDVTLIEGDNELSIVAKDVAGNMSAENRINIIVDNLPPVLSVSAPPKTNLNPFTLSGSVDDSLTKVEANGVLATRNGKNFTVAVPLTLGSNTIIVKATSPNGYVSTKTLTVTLGTIPSITSVNPPSGAKPYASTSLTLSATATDQQADPIEYQFLLNGLLLQDWGTTPSVSWTPTLAQLGRQVLDVKVRDAFGGEAIQQVRVFVIRNPVLPQ